MAKKSAKTTRPFTVVANWKMNKTSREAKEYAQELSEQLPDAGVWLSVPFTAIASVRELLDERFHVGAQNMNDAESGAFTGEIAASMLKDAGADFVILGHSERRQYFHESNEFINKKVIRALESGLCPLLCIGESFEQREEGATQQVLQEQLAQSLQSISAEDVKKCYIAYEPIWAIGTGKTATVDIVSETHAAIRGALASLYDEETAQQICLLYGGSVSAATAGELSAIEGVDGFLVGTASLKVESFAKIVALSENILNPKGE